MAGQGHYGQDLVDAVMTRDVKQVRKILKAGANLDYVRRGDKAIHLAARQGDLDIISALLRAGDSVNKGNQNGNTALHFIARDGRDDLVRYLIGKGADINIQNEDGDTPLHASVGYQPMDLIEYYVSIGMDVNKQNKSGDTPLHVAVSHSRDESVEALLLSDADVDVSNNQGKKAYQLARRDDIAEQIKTYALLKAAKDSGYIKAEGTKLRHKDIEQPRYLGRVDIIMESMSLDPDPHSYAVFYCRREKYENNSVSFITEPEEEVVSDVYHFRVRDVIDEITASFTIPVYAEPSDKQQIVLKFLAGKGGVQTITDLVKVDEHFSCTVKTVLVPETTSVIAVCLCAKGQDQLIGEQAQQISSELEENFTMDIPEGAFQPDTVISLKVFNVAENGSTEGDDSKSVSSMATLNEGGEDVENEGIENEASTHGTGNLKDNNMDQRATDDTVEICDDDNEVFGDVDDDKENLRSKRKLRKRKAKANLMSDVFQINISGEQPSKNIKMQLPLTEGCENMAASDLQVVRMNDANSKDVAILPCEDVMEGNIVNFETEHFCTFVLCPKISDIEKIVTDIKNVKLRRQEARFFAMVQEKEDEDSHVLVIECIKSKLSRRRRKHWSTKGFTKQKPKYTSDILLTPSQEFSIELSGDAKFDSVRGETGTRKLVFSPHRASFQPYSITLPQLYKDGKASVHIYTTETEEQGETESVADSELGPLTDMKRTNVATLKIKLPLPPEEDPFGSDVEDAYTHVTDCEKRRYTLKSLWLKMAVFLTAKHKPDLLKQQVAQQRSYLKKMERIHKEKAMVLQRKRAQSAKLERMRVAYPNDILSGSMKEGMNKF